MTAGLPGPPRSRARGQAARPRRLPRTSRPPLPPARSEAFRGPRPRLRWQLRCFAASKRRSARQVGSRARSGARFERARSRIGDSSPTRAAISSNVSHAIAALGRARGPCTSVAATAASFAASGSPPTSSRKYARRVFARACSSGLSAARSTTSINLPRLRSDRRRSRRRRRPSIGSRKVAVGVERGQVVLAAAAARCRSAPRPRRSRNRASLCGLCRRSPRPPRAGAQ